MGIKAEEGENDMDSIKHDYETVPAFRDWVDKFVKKHGVSLEEALTHELVREMRRTYTEKNYD